MGLYDTYYMDMIREKMERSLKCDVEKFVADWMLVFLLHSSIYESPDNHPIKILINTLFTNNSIN